MPVSPPAYICMPVDLQTAKHWHNCIEEKFLLLQSYSFFWTKITFFSKNEVEWDELNDNFASPF